MSAGGIQQSWNFITVATKVGASPALTNLGRHCEENSSVSTVKNILLLVKCDAFVLSTLHCLARES